MLEITLSNEKGEESLYIQIYEAIKKKIVNKELETNAKLPSKRILANRLGVSVKTIENAYNQLLIEGYIFSKEKSGFYVERIDNYRTSIAQNVVFREEQEESRIRVDFRSNKNPFSSFPISIWKRLCRETVSELQLDFMDTPHFKGHIKLRREIAKFLMEQRGMRVSPEQIVIGSSTEYLYTRLIQILEKDIVYALEEPGYSHIQKIYQGNGVKYVAVPVDDHGVRVDFLEAMGADVLHISPAHQFPLGFVTSINRRVELLEWANRKPNRYIIEDDYNCEYRYQGQLIPSMFSISVRPKVIYMNTFSKTVMPALRVSYMVLPDELMERFIQTRSAYAGTASVFEQITLAKFIEKGYLERHINHIKHLNIAQRKMIVDKVKKSEISNCIHLSSDLAGTHYLLKIDSKFSDQTIKEKLLEKEVLISYVMEYTIHYESKYEGLFIVNYSRITEEELDYFLLCLKEILQED